ncbi:MAG: hypothetical protein IKW14_05400 [Phascolarctobacterium sp.]|nr:hypothetical protein [Phascolarctobacterium sp.]
MNPFMTLTVTTDEKLSPTSKVVELNFPMQNYLSLELFEAGLVSEVNGYMDLKLLVVKQSGFAGVDWVGQKITFETLVDLNAFANSTYRDSNEIIFAMEAYVRFMGCDLLDAYRDGELHRVSDVIQIIPKADRLKVKNFLIGVLESYYQICTRYRHQFFNWDAILQDYINCGYGMLYKDNYILFNPEQIGKRTPLARRLNAYVKDYYEENIDSGEVVCEILGPIHDYKFKDLLHQLNNCEPLPPAFLDNNFRTAIFKKLARVIREYDSPELVEEYERIWVKPTKKD